MTRPRAGDIFAGIASGRTCGKSAAQLVVLALCEQGRLLLRPGQPYRFDVIPGCAECAALAAAAEPEEALPEYEPGDDAIDTLEEQAEIYREARRETWD